MFNSPRTRRQTSVRRAAAAAVGAAGLSLSLMSPVYAATDTTPGHFSFSTGGFEPGFLQCQGYAGDLSSVGRVNGTVFLDTAGEFNKFIVHNHGRDTLTNTVSGKAQVNRGNFTETYTRIGMTERWTHTLTGFQFMATAPGKGLVLQDVGRMVFRPGPLFGETEPTFMAGQHHVPEGSDALFCAAIA
jgi:hypothetical protein